MSLTKKIAATAALLAIAALSHAQTAPAAAAAPSYHCPAELSINAKTYPLHNAALYDGRVEDNAALVPETDANAAGVSVWKIEQGYGTPHLKCRYQGTGHYIVLEAEGAKQCQLNTAKGQRTTASCN